MQDLLRHSGFPQSVPFEFTAALLTNLPLSQVGQGGYEALGGDAVAGAETAGLVDLHLWGFCTNILYSALYFSVWFGDFSKSKGEAEQAKPNGLGLFSLKPAELVFTLESCHLEGTEVGKDKKC